MNKILKKCAMSFVVFFVFVLVFGGMILFVYKNVNAANLAASGNDKALVSSLLDCYNNGTMKTSINATKLTGEVKNFMNGNSHIVYLPYGSGYYIPGGADGEGKMSEGCLDYVGRLIDRKGISIPTSSSSTDEISAFYENLGYTRESTYADCIYFQYNTNKGTVLNSSKLCVKELSADGKIKDKKLTVISAGTDAPLKFSVGSGNAPMVKGGRRGQGILLYKDLSSYSPGVTSWNDFIEQIRAAIVDKGFSYYTYISTTYTLAGLEDQSKQIKHSPDYTDKYKLATLKTDAMRKKVTKFLTGLTFGSYPSITSDEQFVMYQNYLLGYYNAETHCNWTEDQIKAYYKGGKGSYYAVRLYLGSEFKTCYVKNKPNKNNGKKVGGILDSTRVFGVACGYKCVVDWLKTSTTSSLPDDSGIILPTEGANPGDPNPSDPDPSDPSDPSGGDDSIVDCDSIKIEDGSKIGAMQWILCPTMNNMQYTAGFVEKTLEGMLEVNSSDYSVGSNTYTAWTYMQNIANVVMVVLLLLIIFSQVTGYGIDNYGIKKMLPRLIVLALVINLSFYICELAIDLSNIFGKGLMDMFSSFGSGIAGEDIKGAGFLRTMIVGLFTTAAGGVGPGLAIGTTVAAAVGTASLAVPVIIAAIVILAVIVIAVVIMFLMLGARQIIIILCVVLAPLAFAAFILPNAQSLFKKWWGLFKAAIIIYPLCGAVMGLSNMLRSMSFTEEDGNWITVGMSFAQFIIMLVLPYLAFFLLPMLLKNAISALGRIGGALTSIGQTARNSGRAIGQAAMKGVQNSQRYKDNQADIARKQQERRANRILSRSNSEDLQKRLEQAKLDMDANPNSIRARREYESALRDQRRAARASETLRKLGNEDTAAATILAEREYSGRSDIDLLNDLSTAWDSGDTGRFDALTNVLTSRGGAKKVADMVAGKEIFVKDPTGSSRDGMMFKNEATEKSFKAYQANLMQNSALKNDTLNKSSDVYQMVSGGGYGDDNVRHGIEYHSANNGLVSRYADVATQSTNTLKRMAAAGNGYLSQATAQAILNSSDPAINSGIASDNDKREVLEAIATGTMNPEDWSHKNKIEDAAKLYKENQKVADELTPGKLASYDPDALKALISQAKMAGTGSNLYKSVIKATDGIAGDSALNTNLRSDQMEMFSEIRRMGDPNDTVFNAKTEFDWRHGGGI